jgi:hypothetical protein
MDRHLKGNINFRNVMRFGYFMAAGAEGLPNDGGDALHALFERARPMLDRRGAAVRVGN